MSALTFKTIATGALVVIASNLAIAAEENADISLCRQETTLATRIRCLESVIRRISPVVADTGTNAAVTPLGSLSSLSDQKPANEDVPPVAISADIASAAIEKATTAGTSAMDGNSTESPTRTVDQAPTASGLDSLGEEQIAPKPSREERGNQRLRAHVVAFDFVGRDKLRVRLENGQVWRQSNADRPDLSRALRRKEEFEVELWKSPRGRYRMYIPDANKTLHVTRLK